MKNTDFLNLELPEREDKINVEVLTSDFKIIEDIIKQHAVVETMELDGVGAITGAIGPYIRLQNISEQQVSVDIGNETIVLEFGENKIIRETAQNIGVITSGNVHITYFTNAKTYTDRNFYDKKKVDELLSKVEATVEVDAELSETSENPVQNKVITAELASYATTAEVEGKVTEKVAEIVAGAPEDFETLKEMSDWLKEHEDSAASMNSAIQKNAEDIATANENIAKNAADIAKKLDKTTTYALSDEVGGAATKVKTISTSVDADRVVYFGDSKNGTNAGSTSTGVDSEFAYNPATKKLKVKNIISDTTNDIIEQITALVESITTLAEGITTWESTDITNGTYMPAGCVTQKVNETLRRVAVEIYGSLSKAVEANTSVSLGSISSLTYIPTSSPRIAVTSSNVVIGYLVKNITNEAVTLIATTKIAAGTTISGRLEWVY